VAARAKAWACGRSLVRIAGGGGGGTGVSLVSIACYQVGVSASG
jgi:hypothetical protein